MGHLRDHPQHDDVVQPVGCPQQILHSLQLEVGSLVDALPTEQVVPGCPLVEETVPEYQASYHEALSHSAHQTCPETAGSCSQPWPAAEGEISC